jgi:hypothetical protein
MKNSIVLILMLAAFSLRAQEQSNADFSVKCPCMLEAEEKGDLTVYSCVAFEINATYKVEVERYPKGIPNGLTEREYLNGYYADLVTQGLSPELITFHGDTAVLYRVIEPLTTTRHILSDNIVFFFKGKRYSLIVTTVSGTRRRLFDDFANSFLVKGE